MPPSRVPSRRASVPPLPRARPAPPARSPSPAAPRSAKAARLASRSNERRAPWSARGRGGRARVSAPRPRRPLADPESEKIAAAMAEIKAYLKLLYVKREMNPNEVRPTLAIEDPRLADSATCRNR